MDVAHAVPMTAQGIEKILAARLKEWLTSTCQHSHFSSDDDRPWGASFDVVIDVPGRMSDDDLSQAIGSSVQTNQLELEEHLGLGGVLYRHGEPIAVISATNDTDLDHKVRVTVESM